MHSVQRHCGILLCALLAAAAIGAAAERPDLLKQPTLYVVGYAHLDTEWRWEYPQVIREFLPKTMHKNFELFEKYPHYVFNFSGANRYRLMKEYYPAEYETIRKYIEAGRWFPAGSSMEESDVNAPSAESILRQVLYGNHYFQKDFGKVSAEYMLPDCFGFPATLPSLLAHAGVKGFSTQKLTWGSAAPVGGPDSPEKTPEGTPFNVGIWTGPDGNGVLAALNPGSYSGDIRYDLTKDSPPTEGRRPEVDWVQRVDLDGKISGLFTDYHYYGTGDTGGSPDEESVRLVEAMVTHSKTVLPPPTRDWWGQQQESEPLTGPAVEVGNGPLGLVSSAADQMFLNILAIGAQAHFPHYSGDLELTNHSAGSLTSEAYQKRWNRQNELLADAAEKASVAAAWLGARPYPQQRLNDAWTLVMGGQFHDIMAGTATPKAYEFSWNDDVIAMNQFAAVLTDASEGVAASLDTQAKGTPVIVYNPLATAREDVVEAEIPWEKTAPGAVRVVGPDGREVTSQIESGKVLFVAQAPSAGYAVYSVEPVRRAKASSALKISTNSLENARYRVSIDTNGDVAGIFDKQINKELLSAPARLAFQTEKPEQWPAWNMDWADQQKPPRGYVSGPAQVRIVENGPVRVALAVTRQTEGSTFTQIIRLSAGDAGNRVEFANSIDWESSSAALKATFPLTASNPVATYNWDVATIERTNNDPKKFEVPSHQFIDLTDRSGAYGVTVLTDCKNGSDKPADNLLRLTLLYTPGISQNGRSYSDQATQDWGHHQFLYGLAGHAGDWRQAQTDWQALRLNQPLIAFIASRHAGKLGKNFSILSADNSRVRVMALKKAEDSDAAIVRVVEVDGRPQERVQLKFAMPLASAQEMNGQEQPLGDARLENGALVTSFQPYQIRTFAVRFTPAASSSSNPTSAPVTLAYDQAVASQRGVSSTAGFDGQGNSFPAEMLPQTLNYDGIPFQLAPASAPNAETAKGQTIRLPAGNFNRVYLLAAASGGDQTATFQVGKQPVQFTVEDWGGYIGQWDDRTWITKTVPTHWRPLPPSIKPDSPRGKAILKYRAEHPTHEEMEYTGLQPGFIKRASLAWYASHHHNAQGQDEPYSYSYLFAYQLEVPPGANTITLPNNPKIRVLAATTVQAAGTLNPAQPLYDVLPEKQTLAANR